MSNINVMRKNLGPVTAYKYAVQQGYTGTEQEFAALMASYATVAEEAEAAKDDAVDAKTAAEAAQAAAEAAAEQAEGAITVDDTLSIRGRAADAKVVGDTFSHKIDIEQMKKCELVEIPASANRWNQDAAQVGMCHTNGTIYTGDNYNSYKYYDIGNVEEGSTIKTYAVLNGVVTPIDASRIVAFDSNDEAMTAESVIGVNTYIIQAGTARIIITIPQSVANTFMVLIDPETTPTAFIPYSEASFCYVATKDFIPAEVIVTKVDIDGENQVTVKNAQFMYLSPNLIDLSKVDNGYFINQLNGALQENALHTATDWIPVTENTVYTFSASSASDYRIAWYDAGKHFISGEYYSANKNSFSETSPTGAAYVRFSTSNFLSKNIQFESGEVATPYSVYGGGYLLPEFMPQEEIDIVLNLPSKIYALVGYETNIYFENLTEDWERYYWDIACSKGIQLERGFSITPVNDDIGEYVLTVIVSSGKTTVSATCTLVITSASAGNGIEKTVMILGDSTTNNGIAVTKLNENFSGDVMNISTIGTRGTSPNNHEGRSGWRFSSYFNPPNEGDIALGVENPWYNTITKTFDASYYFANTGITKPDWFFINLGVNDVFAYSADTELETQVTYCKNLCDSMIASMMEASPTTKIGVCLTIPPNHSQDAFGKAYKNGQTRHRYKHNNVVWVNSLISEYDSRESEGIYLIPIYTNLDTVYNMGMETLPVNARNTAITYQSPVANGGVHPAESGYWQIADVYTAFLKAHAED